MSFKRSRLVALAVGFAMLIVESAGATRPSPAFDDTMVRIPGHVLPALAKARLVASAPDAANTSLTLTLTLKHDDQTGFERYRNELNDPRSRNYRRFLTQAQIVARFGPSQRSYDKVLAYLRGNGFTLVEGSANHLTITVRGTRAQAERAFRARIADFRLGKKAFYANQADPAMPAAIAPSVLAVSGLSNYAKPRPAHIAIFSAFCAVIVGYLSAMFGLDPNTAAGKACILSALAWCINSNSTAAGYGVLINAQLSCPPLQNLSTGTLNDAQLIAQLNGAPSFEAADAAATDAPLAAASPWPGVDGTGQTIGLVEFDSFNPSDVADYLNLTGAPASRLSNLSKVDVDGGAPLGAGEDEVLLDIDTVMTIAKGAKVVVYDAPFSGPNTSFQDVFNAAINGGATIISNSWAYCEDQTTQADAQSIDTIFQNAAVSDISIFNGAGDSGSTCLDGSPNTIAVPADSPNATAVGGSSLTLGDGATYGSETWWDDSATTPVAGQGGFGLSKFFNAPGYQLPFVAMRSIPDVAANADPFHGVQICQADKGGCPSGLQYGGTSMSAPEWAAFTALLNQAQGHNLGFLNPLIYPFSATSAFHSAASMGSDFAHVGLGSPNLPVLNRMLANAAVGAPDAAKSRVVMTGKGSFVPEGALFPSGQPADGSAKLFLAPHLYDSKGNPVSGKTVTVTAQGGNHATITPPSAMTGADGTALFTVTDSTIESLTFTVKDTTDNVTLTQQPQVPFVAPPATAASIVASLGTEPADGTTADTITVTLKDALSHATPGKVVSLAQNGKHSVIAGPSPAVTDSNGQIQFSVTDVNSEDVTYTATDVTDGNLPVPGNASVIFNNGPGGCDAHAGVTGTANAAPGYLVTTFASGFTVSNGNQGFAYNCFGAYGMAWDASKNLYVTDWPTGKIYKFGTSGGVAGAGTLFTTVKAPATGVAIDPAGNMFASEGSVSGPNGDIVPVDLTTGTVGTAIASGFPCLGNMAIDPAIPALYVNDFCSQGPVDPTIWQIKNIDGPGAAITTSYAQTPENIENLNLAVGPDGTVYDVYASATNGAPIAHIAPGSPPAVTVLTAADGSPISLSGGLGMTVGGKQGNGDAQFVIAPFNAAADKMGGPSDAVRTVDVSGAAAVAAQQLTTGDFSGLSNYAVGPDGCLYVAGGPTVSRISKTDGTCPFGPKNQSPAIALTASSVTPNQGATETVTATFLYGAPPAGTPVQLSITGPNNQVLTANSDAAGKATFNYVGTFTGVDNLLASATVGNATNTSNPATVTWAAGKDHAFLTVDMSPKTGTPGQTITLKAALTDVSKKPQVALAGQTVMLKLGNDSCSSSTDGNGNVSCQVTPIIIPGNPSRPLTADFAGTNTLTAAHAAAAFMFTAPPENAKLNVTPKTLNFPTEMELGGVGVTSRLLKVHVANPKTKKQKLTITFLGADNTGDFTIVSGPPTTCDATLDAKKSCIIGLSFTPTAPGKRTGTLMVFDNADINNAQNVKLAGHGAQGKLGFSPADLNFGKVTVNTSSAVKKVSIANRNPIAMDFSAAVDGDFHIDLASTTCSNSSLPAKSKCVIGVTFKPTAAGARAGTLTFTDSAAKSPQHVKLMGAGK